ncbi:hypothetical protein [Hydrogenophaga sp. T2]|uniref:hypothetical protein n=1 Tax=Hydrogenophaga sp. T2 TaxID=3132823 RepID=UPI003CF78875
MLIYPKTDPRRFDTRLHKGGDGGAAQMRADEEERQRRVQAATDTINSYFGKGGMSAAPTREQFERTTWTPNATRLPGGAENGANFMPSRTFDEAGYTAAMDAWKAQQQRASGAGAAREAMYADISNATRDVAVRDLDRQFTQASNQNLFGLARAGLLGGSVDAESGADLATRYGEGQIRATAAGQGAAADLRSVDEKTRANLISLAQSGLDTGTAAAMASGQMAAATDAARSQANAATVGRLFDDMGQAYLQNQVLRARTAPTTANGSTPGQYTSNLFTGNQYGGTVRR